MVSGQCQNFVGLHIQGCSLGIREACVTAGGCIWAMCVYMPAYAELTDNSNAGSQQDSSSGSQQSSSSLQSTPVRSGGLINTNVGGSGGGAGGSNSFGTLGMCFYWPV